MEGLEATEIKLSEVQLENVSFRYDAEYFDKVAQMAVQKLKGARKLQDLVKSGYRVVYENTHVIDREDGMALGLPFFLQSTDITTPFITSEQMACVDETDWLRYPKGRIIPGEILIEVKGKAEKVAIVPDDFPRKTLVTGTCYKLTVKDEADKHLLVAFLVSRYGQALKDRLKTNLLVSFISKDDLYNIPIPQYSDGFKNAISTCFIRAQTLHQQAKEGYIHAENQLLDALGLRNWQPPKALSYERNASEAFGVGRLDAEYFSLSVQTVLQILNRQNLTISNVAQLRKEYFDPARHEMFQYIEIGAVSANGEVESETVISSEAPDRATWYVRSKDVITSTVRPIRRLSALVKPDQDGYVCSSGFAVLAPLEVPPELLLVYLRLPIVAELMDLHTTSSMYPAISVHDILNLPFLKPSVGIAQKVVQAVKASQVARQQAKELLERTKRAVEIAIETSESAALKFLEEIHATSAGEEA